MVSLLARRRRLGQGLAEVATVCSIMTSMAGGGAGAAWQVLGMAQRTVAISQMKQIHLAVTMYADDHDGRLPTADMYPNIKADPNAVQTSPRSIVRVLGNRVPKQLWVAPRAPEAFQKAGLTYIWNSGVNGQLADQVNARTWLLMDMNAAAYVLPELVPRNSGGYLVLYADGSIKYEMAPPQVVPEADKNRLQQAIQQGGTATGPAGPAGGAGGPGAGGGQATKPEPVAPKDPDADEREKEKAARKANPDEDDAVDS